MAKVIDFAGLSLMDALDLAILIEEEAQERYQEFTDQMEIHHTAEAAQFFRSMADNEALHGASLLARRQERFGNAPRRVTRETLWDVEAPEYDQARAFMSVRAAMEVALAAETKALGYFTEAVAHVSDPEVRQLFEELRREEIEHQQLVRDRLAKLPPGPEPDADDYADEPVAQ
jgi:rubrerythrin